MIAPKSIDPGSIAFDVDGVVADTMRLFVAMARQLYDLPHIRYADITRYDLRECLDMKDTVLFDILDQILGGTHPLPLEPIAGAVSGLRRLAAAHPPLVFVTARDNPQVIRPWLQQHLQLADDQMVVEATGDFDAKALALASSKRTVFVEDRLQTCELLSRHGITPVLFVQPWNRLPHTFTEIETWSQLEALIRF